MFKVIPFGAIFLRVPSLTLIRPETKGNASTSRPFVHPGMLEDHLGLLYMKEMIHYGKEPRNFAWEEVPDRGRRAHWRYAETLRYR